MKPKVKTEAIRSKEGLIRDVVNYIIDFEEDDFLEHEDGLSRDHIFYTALVLKHGRKYAETYLKEQLKRRID